ncbi:hypothetical protein G4B88_002199, partial [Cannabis sativa]
MDSYFWQHTSSGHYSVKTGYHVAKTSINLTQPSSSNTATLKRWWNSIWSLQIPPKITHFIYRLSQKSIPTAENFYTNFPPDSFNLFVCMLWKCWNSRNAFVFRNQCENSKRIQQEAQEYLDLYQVSQKQHQNRPQPTTDCNEETWAPPPIGFLKLNVDGAISSQWGKTGIGALVRDSTGQVIAARASNRMGQMPPKVAEGWALLEASDGVHTITLTFTMSRSNENILSSYGAIIDSIRQVLSSLPTISLHHIRRQGNTGAHNLAQMALGLDNTWCWNSQDPYLYL